MEPIDIVCSRDDGHVKAAERWKRGKLLKMLMMRVSRKEREGKEREGKGRKGKERKVKPETFFSPSLYLEGLSFMHKQTLLPGITYTRYPGTCAISVLPVHDVDGRNQTLCIQGTPHETTSSPSHAQIPCIKYSC